MIAALLIATGLLLIIGSGVIMWRDRLAQFELNEDDLDWMRRLRD